MKESACGQDRFIRLLGRHPLLSLLSETSLDTLLQRTRLVTSTATELLETASARHGNLGIVESGAVAVCGHDGTVERLLAHGQVIAEHAASNSVTPASLLSICGSTSIYIDKRDLRKALLSDHRVTSAALDYLWNEAAQARLRLFRTASSPQTRLATLLISIAEAQNSYVFRLTHSELAQMVGTARETITKILKRWRGLRVIGADSFRVSILDVNCLQSLSEGPYFDQGTVSVRPPAAVVHGQGDELTHGRSNFYHSVLDDR